jgi:hypothetical protein
MDDIVRNRVISLSKSLVVLNLSTTSMFPIYGPPPLAPLINRSHPVSLPKPYLSVDLPHHHYSPMKIVPIPFDARTSQGGKFVSLNEAMTYIARHSKFHHGSFTTSFARLYLPFCGVLDFAKGDYFRPVYLTKREFDAAFYAAFHAVSGTIQ